MSLNIETLTTGEHFGVSRGAHNHCGYETLVVKQYNPTSGGFEYGWMSSEGVMGEYQALKFRSREEAQQFIDRNNIHGSVSNGRGSQQFVKIPVENFPGHFGYVKWQKFETMQRRSERKWNQLVQALPEYFDENDPREPRPQREYRGFDFNNIR